MSAVIPSCQHNKHIHLRFDRIGIILLSDDSLCYCIGTKMAFTKPPRQWLILCRLMLLLAGGLVGGFFICVVGQTADDSILLIHNDGPETSTTHHTDHRSLRAGGGVDGNKLKQQFQVAKAKMIQKLQNDYGAELFENTFMTNWKDGMERVTQGRRFFLSPSVPRDRMATNENEGPSWDRFVRRMAVKVLQAQLDDKTIPFIWATGGHSAAAGHGNYYNESYTANMEKTTKGVFEAVGLDFIGR